MQAFPPGEHFNVPRYPNVTAVNVLGDFSIAADRLAIIDGEGTSSLNFIGYALKCHLISRLSGSMETMHASQRIRFRQRRYNSTSLQINSQ